MDYANKQTVNVIRFPKGFAEERRLNCPPCHDCKQLKLADLTAENIYKNDVTGVFSKKGEPGDIVNFVMTNETGLEIANLGSVKVFPQDSLAVGFVYSWKEILTTHGPGCYTIKITFTIGGVVGGYTYGIYRLKQYSIEAAKNTVKLHTTFNSYNEVENVDFTDSRFVDSIRFEGYFGDRQPKKEISTLISKGMRVEKIKKENLNEYELVTNPVNIHITRQLIDLHLLNEDDILISDHNATNHSFLLLDVPVYQIESEEVEYFTGSRLAKLTTLFGDRVKNKRSYYNKQ